VEACRSRSANGAPLILLAREMEAVLIDVALVMFDKKLGGVFRPADRAH
jgi:hypothetical protein